MITLPPTIHWIRASNGHVGPNDPPVVLEVQAEGPRGEPLTYVWSARVTSANVMGVFTSGSNTDTAVWGVSRFPTEPAEVLFEACVSTQCVPKPL
mmetsp:Transcript_61870/g.134404  ORF Transcript_61870/g.134404 Transcript_61870/m.134404 type:complete len:95 (-) Transcript_61870:797-1081(-)